VSDFFAPAQFRDMSDDAKLAAPAFERLPAGLRVAARGYACGTAGGGAAGPDEGRKGGGVALSGWARAPAPPHAPSPPFVARVAPIGAAGVAPRRNTGPARYRPERPARGFTLREPAYAVAGSRAAASSVARTLVGAVAATAGAVRGTGSGPGLSY